MLDNAHWLCGVVDARSGGTRIGECLYDINCVDGRFYIYLRLRFLVPVVSIANTQRLFHASKLGCVIKAPSVKSWTNPGKIGISIRSIGVASQFNWLWINTWIVSHRNRIVFESVNTEPLFLKTIKLNKLQSIDQSQTQRRLHKICPKINRWYQVEEHDNRRVKWTTTKFIWFSQFDGITNVFTRTSNSNPNDREQNRKIKRAKCPWFVTFWWALIFVTIRLGCEWLLFLSLRTQHTRRKKFVSLSRPLSTNY